MYEWYETEKYANETREIKTVWSPDSSLGSAQNI